MQHALPKGRRAGLKSTGFDILSRLASVLVRSRHSLRALCSMLAPADMQRLQEHCWLQLVQMAGFSLPVSTNMQEVLRTDLSPVHPYQERDRQYMSTSPGKSSCRHRYKTSRTRIQCLSEKVACTPTRARLAFGKKYCCKTLEPNTFWYRQDDNAAIRFGPRTVMYDRPSIAILSSLSGNGRGITALHVLEGCLYF